MHLHSSFGWQGRAVTRTLFPPCTHICPWHMWPVVRHSRPAPYMPHLHAHICEKVPGAGLPQPAQVLWLHPPGGSGGSWEGALPKQPPTPAACPLRWGAPQPGRDRGPQKSGVLPRQFIWPPPALRQKKSQRIDELRWRTPYGT